MSNFLKIGRGGNLYLDGSLINAQDVKDVNEHLVSLLGFYVELEEGLTTEELIHSLFGLKKFIQSYFSEDYETIRAFAISTHLESSYKHLRLYKSFKVEPDDLFSHDEYLYVLPEIDFVVEKDLENGSSKLGDLPIIIDENIVLNQGEIEINLKSKFTLLDVMSCIFDELSYSIKSGQIVSVPV